MEVSFSDPIDSTDRFDVFPRGDKEKSWELIGRCVGVASAIIAIAAFVPILFQRKRRVAVFQPTSSQVPLAELVESTPLDVKKSYERLPCTEKDRATVQWIINTVGGKSELQLAWWKRELEQNGQEIDHLHPYKFIASIFTDARTKESMKAIFQSYLPFKKENVLGGIRKGMERDVKTLEAYLPHFAAELNVSADAIRPMIQSGSWQTLVLHLLETSQ